MTNEWTTDGRPMSRIAQRFWGGVGQRILDSGALDGTQYKPGQTADEGARLSEYDRAWAYYLNDDLYGRLHRAGLVDEAMPAYFNPIPAVVDFHVANTLPADATVEAADGQGDGEKLAAAVALLWRWSNYPQLRRDLTVTAAVLRDVFVKVAERAASTEEPATGVYMQDIPPQNVRWWDVDERGFLTAIRIDTPRVSSIFDGEERRHILVEIWRKGWPGGEPGGVRYYEVAPGRENMEEPGREYARLARTFDELGYDFIPIVWARCDTPWRRQTAQIDRYNRTAWRMERLNRPLAVVTAGGTDATGRPLAAPLGAAAGLDTLYSAEEDGVMGVVNLPGVTTLTWAGTPVDFGTMAALLAEVKQGVIDALPEYRVATLQGVNVATETLQLILNQAEARVLALRDALERPLERAHKMAFTIAQVAGIAPDVFGEAEIGTYDSGATEHRFTPRPVFPPSRAAMAIEAGQHVSNGAAVGAAYRLAQYSDAEAQTAMQVDEVSGVEQ